MMKLDVKWLGFAFGIVWAAGVLLLGIAAMNGYAEDMVVILSSMYMWYAASVTGILIGALWAFVDGFICWALIAWIYNRCSMMK